MLLRKKSRGHLFHWFQKVPDQLDDAAWAFRIPIPIGKSPSYATLCNPKKYFSDDPKDTDRFTLGQGTICPRCTKRRTAIYLKQWEESK